MPYRIAGNFRGRKLSRISRKGAFRGETGRIMGVACLEFRGENFRGWLKNREIHENFLPRKFPATVEPLITDPPRSGQPLYSGQVPCYRLNLA